jgi:hypothetical protein
MAIINNPYPLLDNDKGNFNESHFDVEITECYINEGVYYFKFKAEIDEENINNLIHDSKASFAIKVENKPFYVKIFRTSEKSLFEIDIEIKYENVSSDFSFEFTPLILTNTSFEYINSNADLPICNYSFQLNANQIIGSHSTIKLSFERAYRKINSGPLIKVVKLQPPLKPKAGTMDISLNEEDCIKVTLSEDTYKKFISLNRHEPKLLDALITFPVLQYTLSELLNNSELREKAWAKLLDEECGIFEITDQEGVLKKCDQILKGTISNFIGYFENKYIENQ